jgi:hypothetical protein
MDDRALDVPIPGCCTVSIKGMTSHFHRGKGCKLPGFHMRRHKDRCADHLPDHNDPSSVSICRHCLPDLLARLLCVSPQSFPLCCKYYLDTDEFADPLYAHMRYVFALASTPPVSMASHKPRKMTGLTSDQPTRAMPSPKPQKDHPLDW